MLAYLFAEILNKCYNLCAQELHLCPRLHAAAKIAIYRVFAKNLKNRNVGDFLKASYENCDYPEMLLPR